MIRLKDVSGVARLAIVDAINDSLKSIAMVHDFDDLMVLDIANCTTVANTANYTIGANDWNLTRFKDIYSIRLMDEDNSRKLIYVPFRELDEKIPYIERLGTGKPKWYTQRGKVLTLIKEPDDEYSVYITHTQWPNTLANANDESPFPDEIDWIVVALATDMARSILVGGKDVEWTERAAHYMGMSKNEDVTRPDRTYVAQPFKATDRRYPGNYWQDPFISEDI